MSRAIISTIAAGLIFGGMSAETKTLKSRESPELKVLDRLIGSWRYEVVEGQANGDEKKSTATTVTKWSLQGQYIESRVTDSDGRQVALNLMTYDSEAGVYKAWAFYPNSPKPLLLTYRWNESKKTLTGDGDLGNGITLQATTRFTGNDRYEFTGTTKDASGNVLGEFNGKSVRKK